ncbi:hypothetical protein HM1_2517 [Heliomicrobium modesticaldum Ice1]|uniref:Uncharacterized protein n=1 Tax=Heliobacterium modesticaldum (strain ATCC 51547 / Ice1) TaxID=498761 RepID=B0TAV4_HELMI|nr:hypothetical protein HM1_2517 [Heliomicrobium modesticaldum Ice1]
MKLFCFRPKYLFVTKVSIFCKKSFSSLLCNRRDTKVLFLKFLIFLLQL